MPLVWQKNSKKPKIDFTNLEKYQGRNSRFKRVGKGCHCNIALRPVKLIVVKKLIFLHLYGIGRNKMEGESIAIENAEELVQKYEPMFHKVLITCSIFRNNPDYEDYLQIIRLSFFEKSQQLDLEYTNQLTLMYRFLCWRVRDHQRKQQYQQALIEKVMHYDLEQEVSMEDRILWEDFLERLWPKLSLGERRFLFARLCLGLSMKQIMGAYKVSRSTVLNWKRKLAERFS